MTNLVGKRMLLKVKGRGYGDSPIEEFKVIELSPSGNWIKLQNIYGNKFWRAVAEVAVVEELKPLNVGRPSDQERAERG